MVASLSAPLSVYEFKATDSIHNRLPTCMGVLPVALKLAHNVESVLFAPHHSTPVSYTVKSSNSSRKPSGLTAFSSSSHW